MLVWLDGGTNLSNVFEATWEKKEQEQAQQSSDASSLFTSRRKLVMAAYPKICSQLCFSHKLFLTDW
jgi:hypothetical protein